MVKIMTFSIFMSSMAVNLAYLPPPIPMFIMITLLAGIFIAVWMLPPGGLYNAKFDN